MFLLKADAQNITQQRFRSVCITSCNNCLWVISHQQLPTRSMDIFSLTDEQNT